MSYNKNKIETLLAKSSTIGSSFNYQYDDIIDDSGGSSYEVHQPIAVAAAIVQDQDQSGIQSLSRNSDISGAAAQSSKRNLEMKELLEQRRIDTNDFRNLIVVCAVIIIAIGILANVLFNLLILCRKRRRQTSTTVLMFSMCLAYLTYLVFYCLKLSIYFNVENIMKFHIYDTIDNWHFGAFLCQFISGLPICVKLIVRLSILAIVLKRVFTLFMCDCDDISSDLQFSGCEIEDNGEEARLNEPNQKLKLKALNSQSARVVEKNGGFLIRKLRTIRRVFELPILIILILIIWIVGISSSWPVFTSYYLNEQGASSRICDSVFSFPDDVKQFSQLSLNYLIYALLTPSFLIFMLLVVLFIAESPCCRPCCSSSSSLNLRAGELDTSHPQSSGSSSTSFDERSNSESSNYGHGCSGKSGKNSHLLLWLIFLIHVGTSLPQEIYKYLQLKVDFNDENVLDSYLTSILLQPLTRARPYYALQLLYISEFAIMPAIFILFYLCSTSRSRPTRSESAAISPNKRRDCLCLTQSSLFKHLRRLFYDGELSTSRQSRKNFLNFKIKQGGSASRNLKNSKLIKNNDACRSPNAAASTQNEALLPIEHHIVGAGVPSSQVNQSKKSLKPTPFELAANYNEAHGDSAYNSNNNSNLVHIVQHPSWRINIRQAPTNSMNMNGASSPAGASASSFGPNNPNAINNNSSSNTNGANSAAAGIQLPFNYMKTSMYKS